MNNNEKKKSKSVNMNRFTEEKTIIIKSGSLLKRSKYLKLWKKRFIILTNKNIYSFTSEDKTADCTMNLEVKECKKVENSDQSLSKNNTFASSDIEKYEWMNALKKVITNPGVINEQDELDYANNPDRTISFINVEKI